MFFQWLKHYLPRSLYGRAALILLVPIVTLQLVVSVVFIKRDLEDLTVQMTLTMLRELRLLEQTMASATTPEDALLLAEPLLQPLQMQIRFLAAEERVPLDQVGLLEFSGRVVRNTLQATAPQFISAQFPDTRRVQLIVRTKHGPMALAFDRRRVTAAAPHQLIVTVIAFGFLMTIIAFVYMRNQLRPIKQLADVAQAFGRGRTEPYSPRGANEVRAAGSAFLDMRARIERQMEQRTLMLSGVSHDLRTPLTRMKLGLSMLDDEDAEPLRQDVDEMQALLDAFLDFSRGVSTSEPEQVDPHLMITVLVDGWRRQGKDVMLGEMSGDGTVMLRGAAMRRAVQNLISNAVRYGTRARVSAAMTEKFLRIRVEDDGPGIAEDDRIEATRPFTRLDPARNQDLGSGVGLGLAIVTDIARAHGGTLRLGQSDELRGLQADIVIGR
ncbi:ATP-binding protein [Phaeobacter sp. C3_T13_0]|uniref:ATP-binding protein n=1 Tax=Phaeobacter cretensis TaxID=3342641 RepID=UPI0039BC5764